MDGNSSYNQLQGAPDDSNVPDFLKIGSVTGNYVDALLGRVNNDMEALPKDTHITGLEGTLVPLSIYDQVKGQGTPVSIKSGQLVQKPFQESVDKIFDSAIEDVERRVPDEYLQDTKALVEGFRPKYATNLTEAAAALEVELPTQPQE